METTIWYVFGALGMFLGTAYAGWGLLTSHENYWRYYLVLTLVTGIATIAYVAMALGVGRVHTYGGILYLPRYIDWMLTTPLLVLYLVMLAKPPRRTYYVLVALEVVVIGAGIVAALVRDPFRWISYLVGVAAYGYIVYSLLVVLPRQAALENHRPRAVFVKLRNLTLILWSIYPIVWLLGPFGLGLLVIETEAIVVTYLDLLAKVGFVAIAVNGRDAIATVTSTPLPD
ncbi:Bacteriorhodopsin [Halanaeroarchaeum sp. HSR-CO]|uniref:bacteriorhodopsin n=1 Tax=Halanaeroarchaeum sp. HSR-CO TaxID=2866382 RepID=UPI00217D367C|nr:bacteriorhodopsin [Halanaeroarchaeum sp. HSR-CO]UWG48055.1 Bacteriorhodopsin [Halanaeroarchaeum sp. HSR-CO]